MLNVDEIQNGIVIDHITAGKGKQIYDLLNLGALPQISVALLQNVRSNKYGSKDICKKFSSIMYVQEVSAIWR